MKFTITINQRGIIENGFDLDLSEAAILDWFSCFMNTGKMKRLEDANGIFFWVSYQKVLDDMPMLGTKTKDGVYRRFKKLTEVGFVIPHPENQKLGNSYYRINALKFHSINFSEPTEETPYPLRMEVRTPTEIFPDNKSIIDKVIKDDKEAVQAPAPSPEEIIEKKKRQFFNEIIAWVISHPNKYPKQLLFDFAKYWTEPNLKTKKIRRCDEKYFDISGRLSTFFKRSTDTELSKMWEAEKSTETLNKQLQTLL